MNYLTVTAHPDDEILGFGGTASHLTSNGHSVTNCILSGDVNARQAKPDSEELHKNTLEAQEIVGANRPILGDFPNIEFNTVPHLELVKFVEQAIELVKPDFIFTHHPGDLNNDHLQVSRATQAASRLYQRQNKPPVKGLFFMEILSSTDWSFPQSSSQFQANTFFPIGEDGLQKKIEALNAYKGVMRDFPHPRSEQIVRGLSALRGGESGLFYAEAFQSVFQILSL